MPTYKIRPRPVKNYTVEAFRYGQDNAPGWFKARLNTGTLQICNKSDMLTVVGSEFDDMAFKGDMVVLHDSGKIAVEKYHTFMAVFEEME